MTGRQAILDAEGAVDEAEAVTVLAIVFLEKSPDPQPACGVDRRRVEFLAKVCGAVEDCPSVTQPLFADERLSKGVPGSHHEWIRGGQYAFPNAQRFFVEGNGTGEFAAFAAQRGEILERHCEINVGWRQEKPLGSKDAFRQRGCFSRCALSALDERFNEVIAGLRGFQGRDYGCRIN